jgi:hypothetical protein
MSLKLKVFSEDSSSKEHALKLEEDGSGGVVLGIADAEGDLQWTLLSINDEGKVEFHCGIGDDLGFPLDDDGELLVA